MIPWSSLRNSAQRLVASIKPSLLKQQLRQMSGGHHKMEIKPSSWQYKKMKDLLHFYVLAGAIPISVLLFYLNVFVGPATLTPIPEGYTPKHWEYHKHPLTRFLARYFYPNPQQEYEKYLHMLYEEDEMQKINLLTKKVKQVMNEKQDYAAYYYSPVDGHQTRIARRDARDVADGLGLNRPW